MSQENNDSRITLEFKLKASKEQKTAIDRGIRTTKFYRNKGIAFWQDSYKEGTSINKTKLYTIANKGVFTGPEYDWSPEDLNSSARQAAVERSWVAISSFYRRCQQGARKKGYPKFLGDSRSIEYKVSGWKLSEDRRSITFTDKLNIGTMELQGTYNLNHYWLSSIKRVRIVRRADGYYVQFVIAGISRVLLRNQTHQITAIDVGLENFLTKKIYKQTGLKFPKNKIFPLPDNVPEYKQFWSMLHNAANFAFANRLFLGLMFKQALCEVFGDDAIEMKQVYDTPHNLAWEDAAGLVLHRKGTSPAESRDIWHLGLDKATQERMGVTCGEPVLIPGSMGSASFVMEGCGNTEALKSASHGAGRSLSRGKALKHDETAFEEFLTKFRIITPIDPNRRDIKGRKDILQKWHDSLKKEAPFAYKDVYPVVNTLRDAKIAIPVAELQPILTLKGN